MRFMGRSAGASPWSNSGRAKGWVLRGRVMRTVLSTAWRTRETGAGWAWRAAVARKVPRTERDRSKRDEQADIKPLALMPRWRRVETSENWSLSTRFRGGNSAKRISFQDPRGAPLYRGSGGGRQISFF